jgi:hypothetical protein
LIVYERIIHEEYFTIIYCIKLCLMFAKFTHRLKYQQYSYDSVEKGDKIVKPKCFSVTFI